MVKKVTGGAAEGKRRRTAGQDLGERGSGPRRLNVEEFFDQVISDVPELPPGLADRLRGIVGQTKQVSGAHSSIRKAIEETTRDE